MTETTREPGFDRKKAAWGVLMVTIGAVLFLAQVELIDIGSVWGLWPVIPIAVGLVWIMVPSNREEIASGITMVLVGLWGMACMTHWMGLTFGRSWPLLIAIGGLETVVKVILIRSRGRSAAKEAGHA